MIRQANAPKHILLVDDDLSIVNMLRLLLETRGYQVDVATSGQEALLRITPQTDLILLDIVLPDQEGFDVCRQLRQNQKTSHIPIIMLSARMLSQDVIEGLYLGADDYLTKPVEYEELIARMEAVMRRGVFLHNGHVFSQHEQKTVCELRKIINEEAIIPHFQPIFCLTPFKLLGMEALSRAQTNSMLASPEMLFKAAIQYGLYEELEMLCWRKVMQQINNVCEGYKLFLNCNPYLIEGAHFSTIRSILETESFPIGNIVLEITERSAITDFKAFYEYLKRYRELGVQLAIDDVGGGYASLESIVQTKPDIVKIDRHIIKDIHEDLFKRSIVKLIVGFCRENNIVSIGEGVETKEELLAIKELGVDAAQGYLLYKPAEHIAKEQVQETEEMFIHL